MTYFWVGCVSTLTRYVTAIGPCDSASALWNDLYNQEIEQKCANVLQDENEESSLVYIKHFTDTVMSEVRIFCYLDMSGKLRICTLALRFFPKGSYT